MIVKIVNSGRVSTITKARETGCSWHIPSMAFRSIIIKIPMENLYTVLTMHQWPTRGPQEAGLHKEACFILLQGGTEVGCKVDHKVGLWRLTSFKPIPCSSNPLHAS